MKKEIKFEIPDGYVVDVEKSTSRELVYKYKEKYIFYKDIKSFEDALEYFGLTEEEYIDSQKPYIIALQKLELIIKAINKLANKGVEWIPDWDNHEQCKWYPWFDLDSPGFRFSDAYYRSTYVAAGCASRLYLSSIESAKYVGKEFINLWKMYMVK